MAQISPALVKALREETLQGMMECKKALEEAGGDLEKAKDILRKKGLASAAKKADRPTGEGLLAIAADPARTSAAMVELRCETDFCSRNEVFRSMTARVAELALGAPDGAVPAGSAIQEAVQVAFRKIGENLSYGRGIKISAPRVVSYLHHNGKVGVLVGLEGEVSDATANDLCMHIAFANPMGITADDIPPALIEKEKEIAREQAVASGKPAAVAEKIVAGKVGKFLADNALLEQPFVRNDKVKVQQVLGGAKVVAFARFAVGAG